jgi:hypothetical protein
MAAGTATAPAKPGAKGQAQPVRKRSFLVGTQEVVEGADYDQTVAVAGGAFPNWSLTATGWLKGIWLDIVGTTAGNAVVTVAAAENYPFNILGNIQLNDVNNEAIFGPFDSYTAILTNKYGGYFNAEDPVTAATYYRVALTGTNAAAGSFHFSLWIPLEIVRRDPLGPVASVNNTASLTLVMTYNTSAALFSTPPTTLPSVRIRGTQLFYWEPKKMDKAGRPISQSPPAAGTTQYWTQGNLPLSGGTNNIQLGTALGYPWRNYLFMLIRSAGTRANGELDWPDPLIGLKFEANMLYSQYQKVQWNQRMARDYGYRNTNLQQTTPADVRLADVAAVGAQAAFAEPGLETGVKVIGWNQDFAFQKPGSETRRTYLVSSPGSNWIFNGSLGNAGTLYSIVNYVAPAGGNKGDTASLTGGQ